MNWPYLIAFVLTFIFSFALGIFTILHNYKSKVHRLWFLTSMGVALWAFGSIANVWFSSNKDLGLLFMKLLDAAAIAVIIFYLPFIIEFLLLSNKNRVLIMANYCLGIFFILILYLTPWVVSGVEQRLSFVFWEKPGILFPVYFIYYLLALLICAIILFKGYKTNEGLKKKQLVYLITAFIIGFGGGMTTFLTALFNIYPFGVFIVFLYPILITYGIFLKRY